MPTCRLMPRQNLMWSSNYLSQIKTKNIFSSTNCSDTFHPLMRVLPIYTDAIFFAILEKFISYIVFDVFFALHNYILSWHRGLLFWASYCILVVGITQIRYAKIQHKNKTTVRAIRFMIDKRTSMICNIPKCWRIFASLTNMLRIV